MEAPIDNLVRARPLGFELRADTEDGMPTLFGHFALFNEWTEIHSWFEGDFLERIKKGAFADTFNENRDSVKVLYDHGHDFNIGSKVLGPIDELREDSKGAYYEVPLLDTSYNRDLLPGLEAGLYGASFRFRVIQDSWNDEPGRSDHNPDGLPERTITQVRLYEFGPVTFPAYEGATAGVRSLTDSYIERLLNDPLALARFTERVGADVVEKIVASLPSDGRSEPRNPHQSADSHSEGTHPDERQRALILEGVIT